MTTKELLTNDYEWLCRKYEASSGSTPLLAHGKNKFPLVIDIDCRNRRSSVIIRDKPRKHYELLPEISARNEEILAAFSASIIYDNPVIRVDNWHLEDGRIVIDTSRSSYMSSLLTNRSLDFQPEDGSPSVREMSMPDGVPEPLSSSHLSNHLGQGCICTTSDNVIVFVKRSNNLSIGGGTLGLGMGSSVKLRYAMEPQAKEVNSKGLLIAAMREMEDELLLTADETSSLMESFSFEDNLLACYRDLLEGGKPQLLYEVRLPLTFDALSERFAANARNRTYDAVVDGTELVGLDMRDVDTLSLSADSISFKDADGDARQYPTMPACSGAMVIWLAAQDLTEH